MFYGPSPTIEGVAWPRTVLVFHGLDADGARRHEYAVAASQWGPDWSLVIPPGVDITHVAVTLATPAVEERVYVVRPGTLQRLELDFQRAGKDDDERWLPWRTAQFRYRVGPDNETMVDCEIRFLDTQGEGDGAASPNRE